MVGENNYKLLSAKWNGVNSLLVCPQPDLQSGKLFNHLMFFLYIIISSVLVSLFVCKNGPECPGGHHVPDH